MLTTLCEVDSRGRVNQLNMIRLVVLLLQVAPYVDSVLLLTYFLIVSHAPEVPSVKS